MDCDRGALSLRLRPPPGTPAGRCGVSDGPGVTKPPPQSRGSAVQVRGGPPPRLQKGRPAARGRSARGEEGRKRRPGPGDLPGSGPVCGFPGAASRGRADTGASGRTPERRCRRQAPVRRRGHRPLPFRCCLKLRSLPRRQRLRLGRGAPAAPGFHRGLSPRSDRDPTTGRGGSGTGGRRGPAVLGVSRGGRGSLRPPDSFRRHRPVSPSRPFPGAAAGGTDPSDRSKRAAEGAEAAAGTRRRPVEPGRGSGGRPGAARPSVGAGGPGDARGRAPAWGGLIPAPGMDRRTEEPQPRRDPRGVRSPGKEPGCLRRGQGTPQPAPPRRPCEDCAAPAPYGFRSCLWTVPAHGWLWLISAPVHCGSSSFAASVLAPAHLWFLFVSALDSVRLMDGSSSIPAHGWLWLVSAPAR
ncbi:uncharacterized protein FN964_003734 [Alca torda]